MLRELAFHSGGCVGTGRGADTGFCGQPDTTAQMQAACPQHHGRIQSNEIRGSRTTSIRLLNTSKGGGCTASPPQAAYSSIWPPSEKFSEEPDSAALHFIHCQIPGFTATATCHRAASWFTNFSVGELDAL